MPTSSLALAGLLGASLCALPVASAASQTPAATDSTTVVVGVVFDSLAGAPIAGAIVQLSDARAPMRAQTTTADSLGRFRIEGVRPGRYLAGFIHGLLDVLGIEPPTYVVDIRSADELRLDLAIPGPARMRRALCGAAAADERGGTLVGAVLDAETGSPLDSAKLVLSWMEIVVTRGAIQTTPRHVAVPAGSAGRFVACNVPSDADVTAVAEAPGRRSGMVDVSPSAGGVSRRDFLLGPTPAAAPPGDTGRGDTAARRAGPASVAGTVRRANGRPVEHARVMVHDTPGSAETGASGAYAMSGLPAGTHTLEVRALGFAPKRVAVDLVGRRPAVVDVVLDDRVAALERVVIKGEARRTLRQRRADEFMQRAARIGAARLVTAADIERRGAVQVSDALRMIPGLRVVPGTNTASRNVIRGRMNCVPEVYVDGMIMYAGADDLDLLLSPGDVLGVEVYLGFGGVPAQYGRTGNDCGTVLVWTK